MPGTGNASNTALIMMALIYAIPSTITAITVLVVVMQSRKHGRAVQDVKETLDAHVSEEEDALQRLNENTAAIERLGKHLAPNVPILDGREQ